MKLVIIGSGTCVPSIKRGAPANFISIQNFQILVDCGPGTIRQLELARIDYKNIDMVFVSHFHVDHIADLKPLLQALQWTPGFKRKKDLILIGPAGFKSFYKKYIESFPDSASQDTYKIFIKEINNYLNFSDFKVESLKTIHNAESIAIKFIEKNKSIVISGDCEFAESLIDFSKNCDVLLMECSFENSYKMKGHLISKECGFIARKANVRKLILTHLYPPLDGINRLKETKEIFPDTILAEDLMEVEI